MSIKNYFLIFFLFFTVNLSAKAQDAKLNELISGKVELLTKTIFLTKDSIQLENLLSKEIIYGHSGGRTETRAEMIKGVLSNKSIYENLKVEVNSIVSNKDVIVVRHSLTATEKDKEGKSSLLKLGILLTWVKEKKEWKVIGRQAVKLPQ